MEACESCGSEEFIFIGVLGTVMHFRCRHCGMMVVHYKYDPDE